MLLSLKLKRCKSLNLTTARRVKARISKRRMLNRLQSASAGLSDGCFHAVIGSGVSQYSSSIPTGYSTSILNVHDPSISLIRYN